MSCGVERQRERAGVRQSLCYPCPWSSSSAGTSTAAASQSVQARAPSRIRASRASCVPSSVPPPTAWRHVASCTTVRPRRPGAGRTTQPGAGRDEGAGRRRVGTPDRSTPSMGVSCRSVTQTVYSAASTPSNWWRGNICGPRYSVLLRMARQWRSLRRAASTGRAPGSMVPGGSDYSSRPLSGGSR